MGEKGRRLRRGDEEGVCLVNGVGEERVNWRDGMSGEGGNFKREGASKTNEGHQKKRGIEGKEMSRGEDGLG